MFCYRQGSIVVNYTVTLSGTTPVAADDMNTVVKAAVSDGTLGNFTVDKTSVTHDVIKTPTVTTVIPPPAEGPLPNWGIAVIVSGSVVLIFLASMICILCSRRHARQKYRLPEDPDDIDYRRSWAGSSNNEFAYDNNLGQLDVEQEGKQPVQFYNLSNNDLKDSHIADPSKTTPL